jgi:hypothetical protein
MPQTGFGVWPSPLTEAQGILLVAEDKSGGSEKKF